MALVVVGLSALYLASRADLGWVPHDAGYLGHSAERVLAGELPHRDFDDIYTGGLAMLHALAFRIFGVDLMVLRWVLLAFSLLFVAALYAVTARFAGVAVSGLTTLAAVAWSLPIYFVPIASWYTLFFVALGTVALLIHTENGARRWLFVAGCCAGGALVMKITGAYMIAAAWLFLQFREQELAEERLPAEKGNRWLFGALVTGGVAFLVLLLVMLLSNQPGSNQYLHFLVPIGAIGVYLVWHEWRGAKAPLAARLTGTAGLLWPFLAGVAVPVGFFLLPYVATGALNDLWLGLFVLPAKRFHYASVTAPGLRQLLPGLPLAILLFAPLVERTPLTTRRPVSWLRPHRRRLELFVVVIAAVLAGWALATGSEPKTSSAVWQAARSLPPTLTVAGCLALAAWGHRDLSSRKRQQVFLVLVMTAWMNLHQFPFSVWICFASVASLVAVGLLVAIYPQPASPRRLWAVIGVFFLAFGALYPRSLRPSQDLRRMDIDRAAFRLPSRHASFFEDVVRLVRQRSKPGSYIYAGPDAPEIYFLAQRKNLTRTTFADSFSRDYEEPERHRRILALLEERDVQVVVVKRRLQFSRPVDPEFHQAIQERYPERFENRRFWVYWRR